MRKITFTILILSVIVGLSMCEDEPQNNNNPTLHIDQDFSNNMDDLVRQFEDIQKLNEDHDIHLYDSLNGDQEDLAMKAVKFLQILNMKQVDAHAQIETLQAYQYLASEFISVHTQ